MMTANLGGVQGHQQPIQALEQEQYPNIWTSTKTTRLVLYILTAIALTAAATTAGLAIGSVLAMPFAWLALPLAILGFGAIYWAKSLNDYENPKELHEMRVEAHNMTFKDLYKKHGASNLAQHIAQEEGPSVEDLSDRFLKQELRFEKILDTYDIQALANHDFISEEHLNVLLQLEIERDQAEGNFRREKSQIDRNHPARADKLHQHVSTLHVAGSLAAHDLVEDPHARKVTNVLAGLVATAGHIGAEISGRQEQVVHDQELTQAKGEKQHRLNLLQNGYAAFRAVLV